MTILTSLALGAATLASSPGDELLVTVAPEAHGLLWCDDFRRFRERAAQNDWISLLGSPTGDFLLADLRFEQQRMTGSEGAPLEDLAALLDGPLLVWFSSGSTAAWMRTPPEPEALRSALRALSKRPTNAVVQGLELAGASVELWRGGSWLSQTPAELEAARAGVQVESGAWVALVATEHLTGLLRVPDEQTLARHVKRAVAGGDIAAVVEGFQAARNQVGPNGGLEGYIEFTPFAEEANRELEQLAAGQLTDPGDLLGLSEDSWGYTTLDVRPGTDLELRGYVSVPEGTLLAELADTLEPLPADLLGQLPHDAFGVSALRWNLAEAWSRARAALEAAEQKQSLQTVDAGLAAAQGATGVDLFNDVIAQLGGTFAAFLREQPLDQQELQLSGFEAFGLWFDIRDTTTFQDAFETLIDMAAGFVELEELAGADAYLIDDPLVDGGLALWADGAAIIAPLLTTLEAVGAARAGEEEASLLAAEDALAAYDSRAGACAWVWARLHVLRKMLEREAQGPLELPSDGDGGLIDPFDSQLVISLRRQPGGVELQALNHR